MSRSRPSTVLAAGALLWRSREHGEPEVAVIHRPRYDDWSLPKGKLEPGEHLLVTAVREVAEETGYAADVGAPLDVHRYRVRGPGGPATKVVHYWAMRCADGRFEPGPEVDELRWLDVAAAGGLLTQKADRGTLARFAESPRPTVAVVVIRHASAGRRSRWTRPDRERPLDATGRVHAAYLALLLDAYGVRRVRSSPYLRCRQTLQPYADRRGVPVEVEELLAEDTYAQRPQDCREWLLAAVRDAAEPTALCGQGRVLPFVLPEVAAALGGAGVPGTLPKGHLEVLHVTDGKLVAVERHAPVPTRP